MHAARFVTWLAGVGLVLIALAMLCLKTGLNQRVPAGVAVAGLLWIVGVVVMSLTPYGRPQHGGPVTREEHHPAGPAVREKHYHH